jgi:hypothetical protein
MPPPENIVLGPLTRTVLDGATWREGSKYPAWQAWADELERLLAFLVSQHQFERFLPRFRGKESQLEGALAEVRFAYFLHCNRFRITAWEPEAVAGRPGDLEVIWRDSAPIFIEVKGPGWESELSGEERAAGRQEMGKNVDLEVRAVDSIGPTLYAIKKSLPKLAADRCNLVAVVDDLFWSPTALPPGMLDGVVQKHLADDPIRHKVSGLFFLKPEMYEDPIDYFYRFVPNAKALLPLPPAVLKGWIASNANLQGPRWARD